MPSAPDDTSNASGSGSGARQPGFLARYRRNFKITVTSILVVAMLVGPPVVRHVFFKPVKKAALSIQSADRVMPDAQPSSVPVTTGDASPSASPILTPLGTQQDDQTIKLSPAPLPGLSQDTPDGGALPRIAEDGRQPWQAYARPFNLEDQRPRIALVMTGLGQERLATDAAINRLPASVTLSFNAQSPSLSAWCDRARQLGHETLLSLPMEPFDYPRSDPGPHTLLTTLSNSDNILRLLWDLRQAAGYIGVTTMTGSRFTTDPSKLTPILKELQSRGLMVFDARVAPHSALTDLAREMRMPVATMTMMIDQDPTPTAIDASLTQLEQSARLNGYAIGIVSPLPVTLDRLQVWLESLAQRGVVLAPLSAMVK